jgi:hypothetical protein
MKDLTFMKCARPPAHICAGTGLARQHLHRDHAHPCPHLQRDFGSLLIVP